MTPAQIHKYLCAVANRPSEPRPEAVAEVLRDLKRAAVAAGDEARAKELWCLEQALQAQDLYLNAFVALKAGAFYQAWCELEKVEITLAHLERHRPECWVDYQLAFIKDHTASWQSLFPYRIFVSPEFLQREKQCSICSRPVLPRSFCGHKAGEVYNGELCCRIVTKVEFLGMALVKNPVQRYSVVFPKDETTGKDGDQYDYTLVQYCSNAVHGPFDAWEMERTTRRQPHEYFTEVKPTDPCPCESGTTYSDCCLPTPGVLRPHVQFTFAVDPPAHVPRYRYLR